MEEYVIIIPSVTGVEIGYIIGSVTLVILMGLMIFITQILCKKYGKKYDRIKKSKTFW